MTIRDLNYIHELKISDVPWKRLTTAYGRATEFPALLDILMRMESMEESKKALCEIGMNIEHQGTLWHATPFCMVFLCRVLKKALGESTDNSVAHFISSELLDLISLVLQCYHDGDEMEHEDPLPHFLDMLDEEYLWSEEYDEEEDEMRYEEDEVFPNDLFYSFYYYSWQAVLAYREELEMEASSEFSSRIASVLTELEGGNTDV